MRINKYIAHCGICSRRNAEDLIINNQIKVNGEIMNDLAYKVDIKNDIVTYNDNPINLIDKKYYFLLNKPIGYTCTNKSAFNDKLIFDLINIDTRLFSIGRLDKDSRGIIIITNDGDIYNNVIHPRKEIHKEYIVTLDKNILYDDIQKLETGVDIGGYITNPSIIKKIDNKKISIKINEGKNRQIRRMFKKLGYEVIDLNRISIGKINLDSLKIGEYRKLTDKEIKYLKNL